MFKAAKFKDYLYFTDEEPHVIEFQRLIDYSDEIWYFVISDCTRLTMEVDTMVQIPFTVTFELMNGESHFS